ncbi:hypothetical protein A9HBioS_5801 [Pseudomonas koreensis]|uniref:Uncharacterized protein n=1 Tax=Pseudomonas koreensis TaxID=198620 RepID=A0AA94EIA3_9PSED|nr:hypothetical protein A9HBioS_5801 [Pseudomonas koreensis]
MFFYQLCTFVKQAFQHSVELRRWTPDPKPLLLTGKITRQQACIAGVGFCSLTNTFAVMTHPVRVHNINTVPHTVSQFGRIQVVEAGGLQGNRALRWQGLEPTANSYSIVADDLNIFQVFAVNDDFGLGHIDTNHRWRGKDCHDESSELGFRCLLGSTVALACLYRRFYR